MNSIGGSIIVGGKVFENNDALGNSGVLNIYTGERGSASVAENMFTDNNSGKGAVSIYAAQDSVAAIDKNTFKDNSSWGVWFDTELGLAELKANRFVRNLDGAVHLDANAGEGSAKLVNNAVSGDSHGVGLYAAMKMGTSPSKTTSIPTKPGRASNCSIATSPLWRSTGVTS